MFSQAWTNTLVDWAGEFRAHASETDMSAAVDSFVGPRLREATRERQRVLLARLWDGQSLRAAAAASAYSLPTARQYARWFLTQLRQRAGRAA